MGKKEKAKKAKAASAPEQTCPCCKKHCPLSKPQCSKGKAVRKKLAHA